METIADGAEAKTRFGDLTDFAAGLMGGGPEVELTIAGGSVTAETGTPAIPTPAVRIDTEGDAAADALTNIVVDKFADGQWVFVRLEDATRVVTITHEAGGAGQLSMADGRDLVLSKTSQAVAFYVDKSGGTDTLRERWRAGFDVPAPAADYTASASVVASDSGTLHSNSGAAGAVTLTLPAASGADGARFTFAVRTAQNLIVVPSGSDEIEFGGTSSSTGWQSSTVGNVLTIRRVSSTRWLVESSVGAGWTTV